MSEVIEGVYLLVDGGYVYYNIKRVVYIESKGFCYEADKFPMDQRNKDKWHTYEQIIYIPITEAFLIKASDSRWY